MADSRSTPRTQSRIGTKAQREDCFRTFPTSTAGVKNPRDANLENRPPRDNGALWAHVLASELAHVAATVGQVVAIFHKDLGLMVELKSRRLRKALSTIVSGFRTPTLRTK